MISKFLQFMCYIFAIDMQFLNDQKKILKKHNDQQPLEEYENRKCS